MTDVLVQYSVDRGIARIALDSPRNRNALSAALVAQLNDALGDAEADETVRAVELTHTGSTFCAGADLTEARAGGMQEEVQRPDRCSCAGSEWRSPHGTIRMRTDTCWPPLPG
jgi:enoyl-CoA hydratase/carnithine racemase